MKHILNYTVLHYLIAISAMLEAAVIFPTNSEFGIFMAISVPISLPHRNVFVSYNYEFNFYLPEHIYKFPPILMGSDYENGYLTYPTFNVSGRECVDCKENTDIAAVKLEATEETKSKPTLDASRKKRDLSIISRKSFYAMLQDKLERSGYPPEACLLRMICETNDSTLGEINGLLGNIVHIIFTPSSSRDEQLASAYYQAESDGLQQQCGVYHNDCPHNVLGLISAPIEEILNDITNRSRRK
ncbi:uncharacterized protein LOC117570085 [Drosophila albomicans]|uniref:Uncharacterized protein LOC117570085 n=1 Tax=Drosophila albomicans TaxID=7291 RepID=A0A6P8WUP6_DROAB|nr:uncharacterized protein LOC117570085 [Drosophila albomicans]